MFVNFFLSEIGIYCLYLYYHYDLVWRSRNAHHPLQLSIDPPSLVGPCPIVHRTRKTRFFLYRLYSTTRTITYLQLHRRSTTTARTQSAVVCVYVCVWNAESRWARNIYFRHPIWLGSINYRAARRFNTICTYIIYYNILWAQCKRVRISRRNQFFSAGKQTDKFISKRKTEYLPFHNHPPINSHHPNNALVNNNLYY